MTVIVAARRRDGAVIGADSQATEMTANTKWEVDKLYSLGDRIVWGASGQTAIISEIATALDSAADMIDLPPLQPDTRLMG
ncbi:MAG: hypothetical protein ACLP6E_12945 [Acidimicrobiales bacterium]